MSNSEICKMEITRIKRDSYLYIQQTQNRSRPLEMTSSSFKTTPAGNTAESHFYSMLNEPLHSKWLKYVCQVLLQNFVMYVLSGSIISATLQCSKKMCKIQCWWDMMCWETSVNIVHAEYASFAIKSFFIKSIQVLVRKSKCYFSILHDMPIFFSMRHRINQSFLWTICLDSSLQIIQLSIV